MVDVSGSVGGPSQQHLKRGETVHQIGRDAGGQQGQAVVAEVVHHAGQDAAGLHGQVAEHHAHQAGDDRLLEDRVRHAEEDRRDDDRPPLVARVPQPGQNESAEGQLLANGRQDRDHQQDSQDGAVLEGLLKGSQGLFDFAAERVELHHTGLKHLDGRVQQHGQEHRRRNGQPRGTAQNQRLARAVGEHRRHQQGRRGDHHQLGERRLHGEVLHPG